MGAARCFQSLARDDLPDRGCASLGGHMGGKDDVERWTSLYKGFTPIVVRKVLWCSMFFVTYEQLRAALVAG